MHCFNYVSAFSELDESLTCQPGSTPAAQPQSPCSLMEVPSPSSYPNSLTQQHLLVHEDNTLIDACSGNVHNNYETAYCKTSHQQAVHGCD